MNKTLKHCKPIIGIVGGIGSGKSFISSIFKDLGCGVIDSDSQARWALEQPEVQRAIRESFGEKVFNSGTDINRKALADQIFTDKNKKQRLEAIVHPVMGAERNVQTDKMLLDPAIKAIIWDAPLLFEAGLDRQCDAVIYVDAPLPVRIARVQKRGWSAAELEKREKSQLSLDKKRELADYIVNNGDDAEISRSRIQQVFSQIIALSRT